MEDKNSDNLKILARCISDIEAELIVRLLEDNGIESFVETNIPHSVWPVSADALVIVREEDYDKAKQILKENIENQELIVDEENTNNFSEEEGE
ncbi:MAG TPA: DUF2007 domain-containing protein [Candidatus Hydrogenedens sp.]|nr:DUF2007 domain-containing protein [Candidatus Hydrogenedens sp.]